MHTDATTPYVLALMGSGVLLSGGYLAFPVLLMGVHASAFLTTASMVMDAVHGVACVIGFIILIILIIKGKIDTSGISISISSTQDIKFFFTILVGIGSAICIISLLISNHEWVNLFSISLPCTMFMIAVPLLYLLWPNIKAAYHHCCDYVKNQGWQQDTLPVNDHDTAMVPTQNPEVAASLDAPVSTHNIKSSTNSECSDHGQHDNASDFSDSDHDSQVTQN